MNDLETKNSKMDIEWAFSALKKHIKLIIIFPVIGLAIALLSVYFFITPQYSSTIDILINQKNDNSQTEYTTQQADLQAINTYKDVLKKPIVLQPVLTKVRNKMNYGHDITYLSNAIKISNQADSQIISVTAKDANAYVASDIANEIGNVFSKKIKKIMDVNNVHVVTKATPNLQPVSPNKKLYALIAIVAGVLVGCAFSILAEYFNKKVQDNAYLKEELGFTDLGQIYHIKIKSQNLNAIKVISPKVNSEKSKRI